MKAVTVLNLRGLKALYLGLENCDKISLSPEEIIRFRLSGINTCVAYDRVNGIIEYQSCGELFLELSARADRHYDRYGEWSEQTVFQRLARPDLTSVELIYEDGKPCYVAMPWDDERSEWISQFQNRFQTSVRTKAGTLQVLISRSKQISDISSVEIREEPAAPAK